MKTEFYKKKLKNGLTVLFEKRNLPIISIGLGVRFGGRYEKEKEKGIAHFIEHMLFKGTKKRTAREISKEIDEKGGEHNAFTAKNFTAAWLRLPKKYLEFSIEILSDLFYNSKFDEKELEKERIAILEEIKMYHDEPMRHVFEELLKLMYKKPFGLPSLGLEETVSKFSKGDLVKKYKENYFTENFVLTIVGNADFKEIIKLCEKYFLMYKKKSFNKKIIPIHENGEKVEKRRGINQASFVFGVHFPCSIDKERYAAEVFHSIFSQGPNSKVFQEIREKRGLAYAVFGLLDQEPGFGEELVYIGTLKEKLDLVKEIVINEFKEMQEVSEKELEKEKEKIISSRILQREESKNVLVELMSEEVFDKAENYYNFEKEIKKVKLIDIKKIKLKNYSTFILLPV